MRCVSRSTQLLLGLWYAVIQWLTNPMPQKKIEKIGQKKLRSLKYQIPTNPRLTIT